MMIAYKVGIKVDSHCSSRDVVSAVIENIVVIPMQSMVRGWDRVRANLESAKEDNDNEGERFN
jgi:hypothetical protein